MTDHHAPWSADVKKVVAWLRRTAGGVPHLETLLAHIDGEPARLAAAREKAEAERDELLGRHAEFERRLSELDSAKRALKHMTEDRDRLRGLLKGWSPV